MAAMARRKISNRGRVLAAGVCVAATGLLAGVMAATDDTGNASAGTTSGDSSVIAPGNGSSGVDGNSGTDRGGRFGAQGDSSGSGGQATSGFGDDGASSGSTRQQPSQQPSQQPTFRQPNTRSGGS